MSYNIDTWKTKEIENFSIPLNTLYPPKVQYLPKRPEFLEDEISVRVQIMGPHEGKGIQGTLVGAILETLNITSIDISGTGSGTFMGEVFNEALKKSTGKLKALLVWEGGDTVEMLTVENGKVITEKI